MDRLTAEEIKKHEQYNRLMYRAGYMKPTIFRDIEMLEEFNRLKALDMYFNYEIYDIIAKKFGISRGDSIKRILKNLDWK